MFHLLFIIISYGALLLLLMPATAAGVFITAVMLALGIGLMVYGKVYKVDFRKSKRYLLILSAILVAAYLGPLFFSRWLLSSKLQAIAAMLHIPLKTMLFIGSLTLSALCIYFLYALMQIIINKLSMINLQNKFIGKSLSCVSVSVLTVVLAQFMIETNAFSMECLNFMWGVLIVLTAILFLYCVLGRIMPSISMGAGIFMVISTINVYVYKFRERLFEPVDIFSAGTAMNVAENYSLFPIPSKLIISWIIFIITLIVLHYLQPKERPYMTAKKRLSLLMLCAVSSVSIFFYVSTLNAYHWQKEGAQFNGYLLDFVSKVKEISAPKPDIYNTELIAKLADQYAANSSEQASSTAKPPHIIVIMDEAFSDLRVVGEFSTNREVTPFISNLKEDTIAGYALASVCGGNTANSEYEFLTGNSLAWLSPNVVPYQQYIRSSTYSMVSYLKETYHYKCVAMHPFHASGWNRPAAYAHLGFDACYFIEDFPGEDYVRNFISDQEMFQFLIETYESEKETPLFLFGITMQNHGDYTYQGDNYTKYISLNDYEGEFPEIEQYLSLIHETDKAVEQLITYFQNVDEDVIILFFGDHQPKISKAFSTKISGTTADTLDQKQKRFKVPFFIWANYDIEEEYIDCTGLNYLSSYVYDTAGIPLPPYNRFLRAMEEKIPAINANGFYSLANECYLPIDEAGEEELQWLELYEALQYNNIFDKKHQNETLFPILESQ